MPLVTVVVPLFKTERFVAKCLTSLADQTFRDFEVICVDDCSPDNAADIAETFHDALPQLTVLRHDKNLGLGGARNTAIRSAKGVYIASLDSDDWVDSGFLQNLVQPILDNPDVEFDLVIAGFRRVDESGEEISVNRATSKSIGHADDFLKNDNNAANIFGLTNPAFWNKLWRKELFEKHDVWFPDHTFYQDLATTPRFIAKSKIIVRIPSVDYNYLVRGDSATMTVSDKHILDYLRVFKVLYEFLHQSNLINRYRKEFNTVLNAGFRFHTNNVMESEMPQEEKDQYLSLLLMAKFGLTSTLPLLPEVDLNEKVEALKHKVSPTQISVPTRKLDISILYSESRGSRI